MAVESRRGRGGLPGAALRHSREQHHPFGVVTPVTFGATISDMTETSAAQQLTEISRDLEETGDRWVAAGYPYDGPEWDEREAVYARLKAWNKRHA